MKLTRTLIYSLIAGGCAATPALAALGGDATSVEKDRAAMRGALHLTTAAGYTVHEIDSPGGVVLREYVADGRVFALSWHGPGRPDFRQVLGSFYGPFAQAAGTPTRSHNHLSIATPQVVVSSSGHLRAFNGRAWAPALVPAGFSVDSIN
jgi:hypothetical protein